jgi:hypothetical protein
VAAHDTECLGYYTTLDEYLLAAVDIMVMYEGQWLLDRLDLTRVRDSLESGGIYRPRVADGRVFRDRLRAGRDA